MGYPYLTALLTKWLNSGISQPYGFPLGAFGGPDFLRVLR